MRDLDRLNLPKSGRDGWQVGESDWQPNNEREDPVVYSPHEQVNEPLNPEGAPLSRIEQPCLASLDFEVGFQVTGFTCSRRLDHTGKHSTQYKITPFLDKEGKTKNKSAGVTVQLAW